MQQALQDEREMNREGDKRQICVSRVVRTLLSGPPANTPLPVRIANANSDLLRALFVALSYGELCSQFVSGVVVNLLTKSVQTLDIICSDPNSVSYTITFVSRTPLYHIVPDTLLLPLLTPFSNPKSHLKLFYTFTSPLPLRVSIFSLHARCSFLASARCYR